MPIKSSIAADLAQADLLAILAVVLAIGAVIVARRLARTPGSAFFSAQPGGLARAHLDHRSFSTIRSPVEALDRLARSARQGGDPCTSTVRAAHTAAPTAVTHAGAGRPNKKPCGSGRWSDRSRAL